MKVWLLYRPEPFTFNSDDDRAIHLWVRRCEIFTERHLIDEYFPKLGIQIHGWQQHELFPEIEIGRDTRGFRWIICHSQVNPLSQ